MRKSLFILFITSTFIFSSIVVDKNTELMWQDENSSIEKNWDDANKYCLNLSLSSYNNWRLPNIEELQSIIDERRLDPSIKKIFTNIKSSFYWSSSEFDGSEFDGSPHNKALIVYFYNGATDWAIKSAKLNVRCVRNK